MQISCPQCATVYELDERLLPPGGAPVQCTRCSHVFTASPTAEAPEEQAPAPQSDGTQIYGRTASLPTAESPQSKPMGEDWKRTTQMFGAVKPPAVAPVEPPEQAPTQDWKRATQVFGAVHAEAPRTSTQQFGASQPPPERRTQMFGAVQPSAEPPRSSTQMFGASTPQPSAEPTRSSTQMFGASAPPPSAEPPRSSTQMFGASTPPPSAEPPLSSTQMFGAGAPPPTSDPHPERRTQQFGAIPADAQQPAPRATPMFGTPAATPEPSAPRATPMFGTPAPSGGRRMTNPNAAPAPALEPFELPVDVQKKPLDFGPDPEALIRRSQARRRNVVLIAGGVLVLAALGWGAFKFLSTRVKPTPPEAISAHSEAVVALRRDDPKSLSDAATRLTQVTTTWPEYADGLASHLAALLFQLDDARMRLSQYEADATELNKQIKRLQERQQPTDWRNRVNALIDQLKTVKEQSDPLVERAQVLDTQANDAFKALQQTLATAKGERELQLVRAQALYFGVKGSDQALALSERYKALGGTEGWGDVAYAEYALNARVAPDTRRQAREALDALKTKDPSFIRLYVLIGRLALADKAYDTAAAAFEAATALNPEHETAKALLSRTEQLRAADAEPPAPPPAP